MALDPSNPRSLVGATMGARKRAARNWADKTAWSDLAYSTQTLLSLYAEARARYRIGERLRPCPGCCGCKPGNYAPMDFMSIFAGLLCDGSGTLPARSSTGAPEGK